MEILHQNRAAVCLECLESRLLWSATLEFQQRAGLVLDANVSALTSWGQTNAAIPENAPTTGISIWTVAAAYARSGNNPALLSTAHKAAASLLSVRVNDLFGGGNDGWEAWATADTYLRFRSLIDAAPARYAPLNFPSNPASSDGKYSLADLFKFVLTQSYYAPIDSTSNHILMNATARYLAEQAFPAQVLKGYNNSTTDPTGANTITSVIKKIAIDGPAEYLSPNYGAFNWAELLSVYQLTKLPQHLYMADQARVAFETSLAMNAAWWMNGTVAGPVGRGYPNTGAWQAASGDSLTWTYYGGDYGEAATPLASADNTDVKTLGVLASIAQFSQPGVSGYIPSESLLQLDRFSTPFITQTNFGTNHQYAYNTGQWTTYNESYKGDAFGPYQANWRARTQWTKLTTHDYDAVAWVAQPSTSPTQNANGSWTYVDPYTLQTWPLSGSGTYHGSSVFADMMQHHNTLLQVYNIPPLALAGTPGGTIPARGALIYLPIPKVIATGAEAQNGDGWIKPVISPDGKRLFVAYNSVFMAFLSTAPISIGTKNGFQQFYNIYGGTEPGQQADPDTFLQFAVAQESFSPTDFPGSTLQDQFANFMTVMNSRKLPQKIKHDTYHPAFQYQNHSATLTSEFAGIERYGDDPKAYMKGIGQEFIGGPGNQSPKLVDYDNWPLLRVSDLSGNVLLNMPDSGNMTITLPGQDAIYYDYNNWKVHSSQDIGLSAQSTSGGQITLTWRSQLAASGFRIERSSDAANWSVLQPSLPADSVSYQDSGLAQRTVYYYRVTPIGTAHGTSFPVSAMTMYHAPTNLSLTLNSTNQISLTWANNAALNDGVQLQFSPDGYSQWQWLVNLPASHTSRTITYTDFTGSERLFYRALAYSNDGPNGSNLFSPPSNIVGTEFSQAYVGGNISMPRQLSGVFSDSQIRLTWQDTAINETAYQIERSSNHGASWSVLTSVLPANSNSYIDPAITPGKTYLYRVAARNGAPFSAYASPVSVAASLPNLPPTVLAPITGKTSITQTSVNLRVMGADDQGQSNLSYSWSVLSGPGTVFFSANHSNRSRSTSASFSRAGTYTLAVTIFDRDQLKTSSTLTVDVLQALSSLQINSAARTLQTGSAMQLGTTALDQFGHVMAAPVIPLWSATAGSITSTGLFQSPTSDGLVVVSVLANGLSASTELQITSAALPLVSYSFEEGTGLLASDSSANAIHATLAGNVTFGPGATRNGSPSTGLVFTGSGRAVIGDPPLLSLTGALSISAWVRPASNSGNQLIVGKSYNTSSPRGEIFLRINSGQYQIGSWDGTTASANFTVPTADIGQWVHLTGTYDPVQQRWYLFRNGLQVAQSSVTSKGALQVVNRKWTIGGTDIPDRYFSGSIDEVQIRNTPTSASAALSLYQSYFGPGIALQATAQRIKGPITRQPIPARATLSVLGQSASGESALTYTWHVLSAPAGTVSFSHNGTNAAKNTTATFSALGTYRFVALIRDALGRTTTSYASITISGLTKVGTALPAQEAGLVLLPKASQISRPPTLLKL